MTTQHKSIQYLLNQLANDEGNRERLDWITYTPTCSDIFDGIVTFLSYISDNYLSFEYLLEPEQEALIRNTLSRTADGKAVLSALEGKTPDFLENEKYFTGEKIEQDFEKLKIIHNKTYGSNAVQFVSESLYLAFDEPLRNGKSLDEALTALDKKMEELKII